MKVEIPRSIREEVKRLNNFGTTLLERHQSTDTRLSYHPNSPIREPVVQVKYPTGEAKAIIVFKRYKLNGELANSQSIPAAELHAEVQHDADDNFDSEIYSDDTSNKLHRKILKKLKIKRGTKVLYLGPRRGDFLAKILAENARVLGVDFSKKAVAHLTRRFAGEIERRQLAIAHNEFTELPSTTHWQPGTMDRALALFSTGLHHEPTKLFTMIKEALKTDGTLTIAEFTPFHEELAQHLRRAGLRVEKVAVSKVMISSKSTHDYITIITARKQA